MKCSSGMGSQVVTLFLPLVEKTSWQHGLHGKCLMKQHRCSQDIQHHATAPIHMKIVCKSLMGLHAFCITGPQQWKMTTIVGEGSSKVVVEVSMSFLQQGMHWHNIYDEPYIRQGKMKFMYFQWLQSLGINRIRMTFTNLFIVYSTHFHSFVAWVLFPKNVYASVPCTLQCASHVCIRDSVCVCVCVCVISLVWICVHCLCMWMCAQVCLGMCNTDMVNVLFWLCLVPIYDGSTYFVTGYGLGMDGEMRSMVDYFPEVSKALTILKHCGCKKSCKGRYLCRMLELPCTELWKYNGNSEMAA